MQILIVGINFHPELTGIGKYTGEMAGYLHEKGLEVRVITAPPYYPYWQIQPGYKGWQYRYENWNGIPVIRTPLWVPARPTGLKRLLHLFSFAISSFPALLSQMAWHPDIIFCVAPNFMNAPFALLAARLCGAKFWIHIQDFEVDTAFGLGMLPGGKRLLPLATAFEKAVLRRADHVSTISENMGIKAMQKGVPRERLGLFPNWVDTQQIFPLNGTSELRAKLGIPIDKLVVLYHGSMGRKQGLEILIEAAKTISGNPAILFILCGEGVARQDLELLASNLDNVRFLDVQPDDRLNELVNLADLHVLPQIASAGDLVMPSKLTSMLSSGKAVIGCAHPGTQVWQILQKTGYLISPEDSTQLVKAINELAGNPKERERLGKLGRAYAKQHMEREVILSEVLEAIKNLPKGKNIYSSGYRPVSEKLDD